MNTPEATQPDQPSFRDTLSTVDAQGKRVWVYPKKPKGKFYNARTWVSVTLLAVLFSGPFVRINGEPLLLLNVLERKFVIFGQVFWPQDFYLFGLAMIILVVFIILFTAVYGRLFCGWVCPQTIFMEMVFRKIEYWIEGDYTAQRALDRRAWDQDKVVKKTSKHLIFFALSFLIANTFLAYIIGSEALIEIVTDPPGEHLAGLGAILVFTGAFYVVFSRLREQVCISICPYGRLQGVLLDRQSTVVAYDYQRGEPRGKFRKKEDRATVGKGDCIDCHQCVQVCPTGIDIRNGTQLECVNCTACIDACDDIMDKVNLPKGLIRYASEAGIAEGKEKHWTPRNIAYSVVLVLLTGAMVTLLALRTDVETSILRTPGMMYQEQGNNQISNLYNIKIINKTNEGLPIHLELMGESGELRMVGEDNLFVERQGVAQGAIFLVFDRDDLHQMSTKVKVGVYSGDELMEKVTTSFLGPN
ncbi:MAG: cytochrome c oxidase accessory protein CcoG [Tunicatimonas sp.]